MSHAENPILKFSRFQNLEKKIQRRTFGTNSTKQELQIPPLLSESKADDDIPELMKEILSAAKPDESPDEKEMPAQIKCPREDLSNILASLPPVTYTWVWDKLPSAEPLPSLPRYNKSHFFQPARIEKEIGIDLQAANKLRSVVN